MSKQLTRLQGLCVSPKVLSLSLSQSFKIISHMHSRVLPCGAAPDFQLYLDADSFPSPHRVLSQVSPCLSVLSRLLFSSDPDVLADACWALSYLSDGPNDKIQTVIDSGVCRRLVELLM